VDIITDITEDIITVDIITVDINMDTDMGTDINIDHTQRHINQMEVINQVEDQVQGLKLVGQEVVVQEQVLVLAADANNDRKIKIIIFLLLSGLFCKVEVAK
jgi:hypothetical protein